VQFIGKELIEFIKSATRHSYRPLETVVNIVFESYPNPNVVDLVRKNYIHGPKETSKSINIGFSLRNNM